MNSDCDFVASDNSSKHGIRARFLRVGSLPELTKGDRVWIKWFPGWAEATVVRRLPGNVWLARTDAVHEGSRTAIVAIDTFGGMVAR